MFFDQFHLATTTTRFGSGENAVFGKSSSMSSSSTLRTPHTLADKDEPLPAMERPRDKESMLNFVFKSEATALKEWMNVLEKHHERAFKSIPRMSEVFPAEEEASSASRIVVKRQRVEKESSSEEEEPEFVVEEVLDKRFTGGKIEYLIRWEGYSSKYDTWEPEENLTACFEAIDAFNHRGTWHKEDVRMKEKFPNQKQTVFPLGEEQRKAVEKMEKLFAADNQRTIHVHNYVDTASISSKFNYLNISKRDPSIPPDDVDAIVGIRFAYTSKGILYEEYAHEECMIYECNSNCQCNPEKCSNRVIQRGSKVQLQLFRTVDGRGWGVRTLEFIPKGVFVAEYVGEIIPESLAEIRGHTAASLGSNYLFDLDADIVLEEDETSEYTLDARYHGNVSRFFNHCCDPNLIQVPFVVDEIMSLHRIAFFTRRDVCAGEELTFDYTNPKQLFRSDEIILQEDARPCLCRAAKCRKMIRF